MKKQILTTAAVMSFALAFCASDLLAAGNGKGGNSGQHGGAGLSGPRSYDINMGATRPTGSQRRDGTFLSTGTTANGSTSRPSRGNGVQDGSHLSSVTPEPYTSLSSVPEPPTAQ